MVENIKDVTVDNEFKVKFDGELHEIDANTFVNYLIHLNSIIQEVNRELKPETKIDVKIKALERGSFLVHIELIRNLISSVPGLFNSANLTDAASIVAIVSGLYNLKQFLAGKKPAQETASNNGVTIQNQNGGTLTVTNHVYNIYTTNFTVNEAISKSFQTLENDESIAGFSITDVEEKPIITIPREDFSALSEPNQIIEKDTDTIDVPDAKLSIIKLSFDPKLKSDFYYEGRKITAKVIDQTFYRSIDQGRSFSKGDSLVVVLKIKRVFDQSVNHYIHKGYEVVEVIQHIPREQQQNLF
ncbi:hypothetical protein [Pontibacter saemangeumensis]